MTYSVSLESPLMKRVLRCPEILTAYSFASAAHEGQTRQDGSPYIYHPMEVAHLVLLHSTATDDMLMAALLHDVVEDCGITLEEIKNRFGTTIRKILYYLTNPIQETDESRNAYFLRVHSKWAIFSYDAKIIKCADRLHNLRSMDKSTWEPWQKKRYAETALNMLQAFSFDVWPEIAELLHQEAVEWIARL